MASGRLRIATITMSDKASQGERDDASGRLLQELLAEDGHELLEHRILPDDAALLEAAIRELAAEVDAVITTGGTGLAPRDITSETTAAIVEKRIPGIETALMLAGRERVPTAILSRPIAGTLGQCVVVNLPGSSGGVRDGVAVLRPVLTHAVLLLSGNAGDCHTEGKC